MKNFRFILFAAAILSAALLAGCVMTKPDSEIKRYDAHGADINLEYETINAPAVADEASGNVPAFNNENENTQEIIITQGDALKIALEKAGINAKEEKLINLTIELDLDDVVLEYEVDFTFDGYEYNIDINAVTGEVRKYEKDIEDDKPVNGVGTDKDVTADIPDNEHVANDNSEPEGEFIGKDKVKDVVFTHAGVVEGDVYDLDIELDRDRGIVKYEVDFKCNGYEYEYDIKAIDGSIIYSEKEIAD